MKNPWNQCSLGVKQRQEGRSDREASGIPLTQSIYFKVRAKHSSCFPMLMVSPVEDDWYPFRYFFKHVHEGYMVVNLEIQVIGNISVDYKRIDLSLAENWFEGLCQ